MIVRQGALEFGGELTLLAVLGPHRVGVQLDARAALALRAVHGRIGMTQQVERGIAAGLPVEQLTVAERHTNAHREVHLDPADHHLAAQSLAHTFSEIECSMLFDGAIAQHHELVATDTGDHIGGPRRVHHALRHLSQQGIAHVVAGVVVHVLQLVEVEEQQGHLPTGAPHALEFVGCVAQQQHAVGQACERVVSGLMQQLTLHLVTSGDIADDAAPVFDDALGIAMDDEVDVEEMLERIGPAEAHLTGPLHGGRRGDQFAGELVADGLQQRAHRGVAYEVDFVGDAEQCVGSRIGEYGRAVAIEDDDGIGRRLDHAE